MTCSWCGDWVPFDNMDAEHEDLCSACALSLELEQELETDDDGTGEDGRV